MKKNSSITAFYLETLVMIAVLIAVILLLTQIFGLAQKQSTSARQLTNAVILAGNAAEAVSASADEEELLTLLNKNGNAQILPGASGVTACYDRDMQPDPQGTFRVDVSWEPEETNRGTMIRSEILVRCGTEDEPVYRLETASFREEET